MSRTHKQRIMLVTLLLIAIAVVVSLVLFALRQNLNLFYTPQQVAQGEAPKNKRIRIGGMVTKGSVLRKEGLRVQFIVTDFFDEVLVEYQGILPDLFKEGQGVVALGTLVFTDKLVFIADQILAKHDENYMPPEVLHALSTDNRK